MGKINVLSFEVANLIAAGEVVDRPASVVKELMENAIDAGATQVTCEIKGGGVSMIRVTDNGCGMTAEDLPLCIRRHATSKIHSADDLTSIATLGFRGEALAAIASVSRMTIITKTAESPMGTMLTADGGAVTDLCEVGAADGTTVVTEGLFANVPARRKFLKKDRTESMAVSSLVEKIALSRPDVSVRFVCDGDCRFVTEGDGDVRHVLYALYGKDFAARLLPLSGEYGGVGVEGYIGTSENNRGNRSLQNTFINGRYVRSKTVVAAVEEAFTSYMAPERFPVCCVYLTVDCHRVDVNVHPSKMEVRFSDERPVFEAVYWTVRKALEKNEARPEYTLSDRKKEREMKGNQLLGAFTPLGGGPKAEQTAIPDSLLTPSAVPGEQGTAPSPYENRSAESAASVADAGNARQTTADMPYTSRLPYACEGSASRAAIPGNAPSTGTRTGFPGYASAAESGAAVFRTAPYMAQSPSSAHLSPRLTDESTEVRVTSPNRDTNGTEYVNNNAQNSQNPLFDTAEMPTDPRTAADRAEGDDLAIQTGFAGENAPLAPDSVPIPDDTAVPSVPETPWRLIGVAFDCYLIVDCGDSLLLVDQHAAHERILFEQLRHEVLEKGRITAQSLLLPLSFSLSSEAVCAALGAEKELSDLGYTFTVEDRTVTLTEIPSALDPSEAESFFSRTAEEMADGGTSASLSDLARRERTLYQMACKAAIKGGRSYDEAHLRWLIDRLHEMPQVLVCPHGRPIAYRLTRHELDHRFGRI